MNRDLYFFARVFLALTTFCGLLQAVIFFFLGSDLMSVRLFPTWILAASIVNLVSSVFVLKYYYEQRYYYAFATGILVALGVCFQAIVVFMINIMIEYYMPGGYFLTGSCILYASALLFSNAARMIWLKWAGILIAVVSLGNLIAMALIMIFPEMGGRTILIIFQLTTLGSAVVPILFIKNFLTEEKFAVVAHAKASGSKFAESLLTVAAISAFLLSTVLGFKLVAQSATKGRLSAKATIMSQQFEARTYFSTSGKSMQYRLLKPLDYDSTKTYPLAVCLHGGAGWGTDNIKQFDGSLEAQILSTPENRKKYPAFLFVPQCPPGASWGGIPRLQDVDTIVFEIIDSLEREFSIDTHRRYVMGHSLGGFGAWYFIGTRPDMFAAAVPSAGFGDPKFAKDIVDVPVWAFHGRLDRNAAVSGSRDIIEAIRKAGGTPKYTEYPDIGHGTWDPMKNTPELMEWVFAQRRE